MKHRRPRGKPILRCPNCGSDRINYEAALITGQRYHCMACDYLGSFVVEQDAPITDP
ncbi:MAG: hypothetical protein ACYDFT_02535 [Thermoplasmata archaeon]